MSLTAFVTVRWVEHNRDFLQSHSSPLEFYLHRSEYLRLLTPEPSEQSKAIEYANKHLQPFFATHSAELKRLMCCLIFLPKERMQKSPYEDLTSEAIHLDLENIFATEFSASLGMSKQPPLRVVGDIGGGGALAKIEKGRKIMRERKSEWSQIDELPVCCLCSLFTVFPFTNLIDRNTSASGESLSFDICMSRVEGTSNGTESTHDDDLWTCNQQG